MAYSLTATTPTCNIPLQVATVDSTYGNPKVQSLRVSKESQLETIPYPSKDSNYAIVFDILGVLRNFTIQGNNQGTVAQLKKFILDIEARVAGAQYFNTTPSRTTILNLAMGGASSDIDVAYYVVIKTFSWNFNAGTPLQIEWVLECVEASTS